MEYGGRDEYTVDVPMLGRPEMQSNLQNYGMPARASCYNKHPMSRANDHSEVQRLAPLRTQSTEQRYHQYVNTPQCERFSPSEKQVIHNYYTTPTEKMTTGGSETKPLVLFNMSEQNIVLFFFIIVLVVFAMYFQNSMKDLKQLIKDLHEKK